MTPQHRCRAFEPQRAIFRILCANLALNALEQVEPHWAAAGAVTGEVTVARLDMQAVQNFGGNVGGSFAPLITGFLISASNDFTVPLLVAEGVALVFGCGSYGLIVGNLDRELGKR